MSELSSRNDLSQQVTRLLRFRFPLAVVVLLNVLFVARVPWASLRGADRDASSDDAAVAQAADAKPSESDRPAAPVQPSPVSPAIDATPPAQGHQPPVAFDPPTVATNDPILLPQRWQDPPIADRDVPDPVIILPPDTYPPTVPKVFPSNGLADRNRLVELNRTAQRFLARDFPSWVDQLAEAQEPHRHTTPPPRPRVLVLENPIENDGPVHFLVDGVAFTLLPGETRRWESTTTDAWQLEFHRGLSLGDAQFEFGPGIYRFDVSYQGWDLRPR